MKLVNDDCVAVLRAMPTATVDHVITDLPYFNIAKTDFDHQWADLDAYMAWVRTCMTEVKRVTRDHGNVLLFCSRQNSWRVSSLLDDLGFTENRMVIWARKRGFNTTRGNALTSGYEPILFWSTGQATVFNQIKVKPVTKRVEYTTGTLRDGVNLSDVWTDIAALPHNSREKVAHPTQKPVKLMERLVTLFTNPGDTVLDFCMGSGSTGVACANLGREFIGVELDRAYFAIAKARLS